jgi:excisionase family DNA binding protein
MNDTKLTVKQAAARAGVSASLVYEWCQSGALPHFRFGCRGKRGCIRIVPEELDAFLTAHRVGAKPEEPAAMELKHIRLT